MKNIHLRRLALVLPLIVTLEMSGLAAKGGPAIQVVDGKLSVKADAVPLSWFLKTLDKATGMSSTLPPNLANRNISVQFSDLSINDAVHKIFEGQRLDYVLIQGGGIVVTGTAAASSPDQGSAFVPPTAPSQQQDSFNSPGNFVGGSITGNNDNFSPLPQPFPQQGQPFQGNGVGQQGNGQEPAMIQTPFGPIPNPRANQGAQQANPTAPMAVPGQQQPFGSQGAPFGQANPFGIGTPAPPSNPSNLPNAVYPGAPTSPFGSVLPGQTQPRE